MDEKSDQTIPGGKYGQRQPDGSILWVDANGKPLPSEPAAETKKKATSK